MESRTITDRYGNDWVCEFNAPITRVSSGAATQAPTSDGEGIFTFRRCLRYREPLPDAALLAHFNADELLSRLDKAKPCQ